MPSFKLGDSPIANNEMKADLNKLDIDLDNDNDEELSIHRNEDGNEEERKTSEDFRLFNGSGGRLKCPAPSCCATRGLI